MADENAVLVVEPSATAVAEFNPSDQHTWSSEQREHWNKTGDIPAPPKKEEPAASESSTKETQSEPKGKIAAEPEAAPKQEKKERKPGDKPTAEERISQLTAKVKELEAERERSRSVETKPPATPPRLEAPSTRTKPKPDDLNEKGAAKYATYEDYVEDLSDWKTEQRIAKLEADRQAETQRQLLEKEFAAAQEVYPEFLDKTKPIMTALLNDASIPEPFKAAVGTSDVFTHLLYALTQEQSQKLMDLAKTNTIAAIKKLGELEATVRSELAKSKESKPNGAAKEPEPPAKPKPRAPVPPSEVGGRGTAPADSQAEAARTGDFTSFEREENRKRFASQ